MSIKILATADLHLGRKSSAVPSAAEESSTKYTWNNMVNWAIEHGVHILLLSGDIIDQDNKYYEAIGPIQTGFDKLNKNGIAVYLVTGNHDFDVLAEIIRSNKYENIHLLGADGNWEKKTYNSNEATLQIIGWSFPNKYVTENPMAKFSEFELDPDAVTIGLLHGDVDAPESKYGPISLNDLKFAGAEAWILGHIHKPIEFSSEAPYIAYPGSPHALDPGESGVHGPVLLEVDGKNDMKVERLPLSPIRYEKISVTIEPGDDEAAVRDSMTSTLLQEGQKLLPELENVAFLVYDIVLEGTHTAVNELFNWTSQIVKDYEQELETGTRIIVRKVENNVRPAVENLEELAENPSPAGKLAETILAIQQGKSTPFLDKLTEEWKVKLQKINKAGTYAPLKANERLPEFDEKLARE
ncbi:MAG: metallophosphoesterase family protein, partial [Bacteroidota bacterium]